MILHKQLSAIMAPSFVTMRWILKQQTFVHYHSLVWLLMQNCHLAFLRTKLFRPMYELLTSLLLSQVDEKLCAKSRKILPKPGSKFFLNWITQEAKFLLSVMNGLRELCDDISWHLHSAYQKATCWIRLSWTSCIFQVPTANYNFGFDSKSDFGFQTGVKSTNCYYWMCKWDRTGFRTCFSCSKRAA